MEQKVVLDSDVIIDFVNGRDDGRLSTILSQPHVQIHVSAITVFELSFRTYNQKPIDDFLKKTLVLNLDADSARASASIGLELNKKGIPINTPDLLIAGTCIANACALFTNNHAHFKRISQLEII